VALFLSPSRANGEIRTVLKQRSNPIVYASMKGPLLMPNRPRLFRRARYHHDTIKRAGASDTGDSGLKCLDVTNVEQIGAD
jgi:hypothetical protein